MTDNEYRWRISLHEAAHGVACVAYGGRTGDLVIYDNIAMDGVGGRVKGLFNIDHLAPHSVAVIWLAGAAAEARFGYPYAASGRTDLAKVQRSLGLRPKDVWPQVLRFIDLFKPQIETVARRLDEQGTLSGDELVQLMRHRGWGSPRWQ